MTANVSKRTRASAAGKMIYCPNCNGDAKVYHFSWSALVCKHCDAVVEKYEWRLAPKLAKQFTNRLMDR